MEQPVNPPRSLSDTAVASEPTLAMEGPGEALEALLVHDPVAAPPSSKTSRSPSYSTTSSLQDDDDSPIDKVTLFDILGNLALPQKLEKWQNTLSVQKDKVRRQQEKLKSTRQKVAVEWRKRMPSSEEQLDKYRKRMKESVERLGTRWNDIATVTVREKTSFIAGVFNIFISGYLLGAHPAHFYYWFTAQLVYFMPVRYYKYHQKGYHYFLADLCYFVNFLTILSLWVFPQSKRLLLSTYCLAYGNNAVAIAMWRNSLVFHSLDKVTSLFIHIMPPVTLHCLIHMTPLDMLRERFPAAYLIKHSTPGSPEHYTLQGMIVWATVPYAVWQLSYHFLITVRRREKIAAGRPTSFTWLRRSYAKTWIGKFVLSLPNQLQEPAFMLIQYCYAVLTMIPCPLWFWYPWASSLFLLGVFFWSIYNGATYYIDVFGKRFQNELEQLKKDVRWQSLPAAATFPSPETESKEFHSNGGPADGNQATENSVRLQGEQGSTGVEVESTSIQARS